MASKTEADYNRNVLRVHKKILPGWAPSSITCNFEVIWPALVVFEAKQIKVEGVSFPGTWIIKKKKNSCTVRNQYQIQWNIIKGIKKNKLTGTYSLLTLKVLKVAACASRAWLRCCSTEKSCMFPLTSCGLYNW